MSAHHHPARVFKLNVLVLEVVIEQHQFEVRLLDRKLLAALGQFLDREDSFSLFVDELIFQKLRALVPRVSSDLVDVAHAVKAAVKSVLLMTADDVHWQDLRVPIRQLISNVVYHVLLLVVNVDFDLSRRFQEKDEVDLRLTHSLHHFPSLSLYPILS